MPIRQVEVFRTPSAYDRELAEARRRAALAEALAQQQYTPSETSTAPIPRAAPLVRALQGYLTAREERKAREAEERARQADTAGAEELLRDLKPEQRVAAPTATEIARSVGMPQVSEDGTVGYEPGVPTPLRSEMVERTKQERDDRLLQAMVSGTPRAQALAQLLASGEKEPEAEEFYAPTETAEGLVQFGRRGGRRDTGVRAPVAEAKPKTLLKEVDLGDRIELHYSDGSIQTRRKGIAPSASQSKPEQPTEGERKDAYNLERIINSSRAIQQAIEKDPNAETPGFFEAMVGAIPFAEGAQYRTQSPQRQVVAAAQTDLVDAFLTLATGAAYTKEQLRGQMEALLPRYAESDESIAAKKERVRALAKAARVRAGRAWNPEMQAAIESVFGDLQLDEEPIDLPPPRGRGR